MIYKPNFAKKIFATLIDYIIVFLAFYIYLFCVGTENDSGHYEVTGWLTLPVFIIWPLYFVAAEAAYGATLGHLCFNLKILTSKREPISFTQALKRRLLDPLDIFIYGIPAFIAIKNSDKCQRLGDMWADTIVVDVKDPLQYDPNAKDVFASYLDGFKKDMT